MIILLSKQIETLRKWNGWSQAELAHRLHISPSAIGMYEQGRREPSIEILMALSKEFRVTVDYLITGNPCSVSIPEFSKNPEYLLDAFSEIGKLSREELIVLLAIKMLKH